MATDKGPNVPSFPLQVETRYINGIVTLTPKILVEITVRDVLSGREWKSGRVPAPPPLDSFGEALNKFRASITYPSDPIPPTRTLDSEELRPYCWRYRHAYEYAKLDEQNLKQFRLQLFKEWEEGKREHQIFPYRVDDKGLSARNARKAARRNFNDALEGYLAAWKKNRQAEPCKS